MEISSIASAGLSTPLVQALSPTSVVPQGMNDAYSPLFLCHLDDEGGEPEANGRLLRCRLDAMGVRYKSLHIGTDGTLWLNVSGTPIANLSPLTELPLTHLCLQGCYGIADFTPLDRMRLVWLNLCRTSVTDLSPLARLPLIHLDLHRTRTTDLSPLKDLPLRSLDIRFTKVTDLSPLGRMPLEALSFYPSRIARGLDLLRGITSLATINRRPAKAFWRRHGGWRDRR